MTFVTALHTLFPKWGVRGMNVVSLIKMITLVFIVVTGWVVLAGGIPKIQDPHASFRDAFQGTTDSGYHWATAL